MTIRTGIPLFLAAMFFGTALSACVRAVAADIPVGQIIFWRSALALPPILLYMALRREFPAALRTQHPRLHLVRNLAGVLAMALLFGALARLPVANAQALGYLAPILTLPMAALMVGERPGRRVYAAMALGVVGVAATIGGALSAPGSGAIWGIAAGLGFACTMAFVRVHLRTMTRTERPSTIAFYFALTGSAVGLLSLPLGWSSLDAGSLAPLAASGLLGALAHIASAEAIRRTPVSTLAPLEYTGLIWAIGFDTLIFKDPPGAAGLAGAAVITAAVLLVTWPKRSVGQRAAPPG